MNVAGAMIASPSEKDVAPPSELTHTQMLSPEGTLFKSWNVLFSLSGGVLTNTWVAALQLQGQGPPCGPGRPDLSLRLSGAGKGGALPLAYRLPIRLTGRPSRAPGLNAQEPRRGLVSASPSGFPPVRAPPWVPPGFEAGPAPKEPLRFRPWGGQEPRFQRGPRQGLRPCHVLRPFSLFRPSAGEHPSLLFARLALITSGPGGKAVKATPSPSACASGKRPTVPAGLDCLRGPFRAPHPWGLPNCPA